MPMEESRGEEGGKEGEKRGTTRRGFEKREKLPIAERKLLKGEGRTLLRKTLSQVLQPTKFLGGLIGQKRAITGKRKPKAEGKVR